MEIKLYKTLCDDALKIRVNVFVEEQGFNDEFDSIDETAFHLVGYIDGVPVATTRFFYENDPKVWHIGRVAVLKEYRKKGLGKMMMERAEKEIKALGGKICELSAQVRASEFYSLCGYRAEGEEYLDEYCPHIKMVKKL